MNIIINDKPCDGSVGDKLLRIAMDSKSHVGHVCGGLGICQTCYVTVLEGDDCLSSLSDVELAFLSERQVREGARLACQVTIENNGTIRVLSRPEEVRRLLLSNPLSLFSYSVDMGKSAAERFVPGVTNVIDRIQKGEVQGQGQAALDEAFAGMGKALQNSIDSAKESIPFKEQINVMVDFCRKMLPFSDVVQKAAPKEHLERVVLKIGGEKKQQKEKMVSGFELLGFRLTDKLEKAGVFSMSQVLQRGKTPSGRKAIAEECGISIQEVLTLVNYADLCRVQGISIEIARLLEAAGVDTVPELSHRNPDNLHKKLLDVNLQQKLARHTPSMEDVAAWIAAAKELPREISF